MASVLDRIKTLAANGDVRVSEHGYDALVDDDLSAREVVAGAADAMRVEDYPHYGKGPAVLALQRDGDNNPIHVLWGIPKGTARPAVIITTYRPDPE